MMKMIQEIVLYMWLHATLAANSSLPAYQQPLQPGPRYNQVVIITQGRSGSSFIGELLSQVPGAMYLYEPCRSLNMTLRRGDRFFGEVNELECQSLLSRVLACEATAADASRLLKDWVALTLCNKKDVLALANKKVALEEKKQRFNDLCRRSSLRVAKEIRLNGPGPDLGTNPHLGIIHLVRDVRAVVNSRLHNPGFCLRYGAPGCAAPVCAGMQKTLDHLAPLKDTQRDRVRTVKFEDMCDAPLQQSKALFDWLGVDMGTATKKWVNDHTKASNNTSPHGPGKYGTSRSESGVQLAAHGWETNLGTPEIGKINSLCRDVLLAFGYPVATPALPVALAPPASQGAKKVEPWWKVLAARKKQKEGGELDGGADATTTTTATSGALVKTKSAGTAAGEGSGLATIASDSVSPTVVNVHGDGGGVGGGGGGGGGVGGGKESSARTKTALPWWKTHQRHQQQNHL